LSDPFERAARLKKARQDRGFKTARLAAEYINIPYGTYSGHENGSRGIKDPELIHYAKIFRVSPSWLAFGEQQGTNTVRIVGVVSGSDTMEPGRLKKTKAREVTAPFPVPVGVTALHISTNDFAPHLHENDFILIGAKSEATPLLNHRVALSSRGTILIGILLSSAKSKHFHVQLFNGRTELDLSPDWVAPIIGILYRSD